MFQYGSFKFFISFGSSISKFSFSIFSLEIFRRHTEPNAKIVTITFLGCEYFFPHFPDYDLEHFTVEMFWKRPLTTFTVTFPWNRHLNYSS